MYDRVVHLLGLSEAAFAHDPELLVTRLRTLATTTGRSDSGMTVDDRVELIERMSMFMDTRASQLAAAGRVSGVVSGELKSWTVPAAEHRRLCGSAVQMLAVLIAANAVCADRMAEARAVGTQAAAPLAAIVSAATSGSKLPPLMACALGNVLLLLATDCPRQSVWDSITRSECRPQCVWVEPAFVATLGACDGNRCTEDVSDLNDRSREAEVLMASARPQWLWPLIASCPYPMGMIAAGYVVMQGTADLRQIVVALVAIFGCIIVAALCFEWKAEASAWKHARELQCQWIRLLNEACVNLCLPEERERERAREREPAPEPEPEPEPGMKRVEVNMAEGLVNLHSEFESITAGESGGSHNLGLERARGLAVPADTGETSRLAVPIPDDLEPNLELLLGALEKEGDAETVDTRDRVKEQLLWLRSHKGKGAN